MGIWSITGVTRIPVRVEEDDDEEEDPVVDVPVFELVGELFGELFGGFGLSGGGPSVTGGLSQLPTEIPSNLMQGK